MKTASIPARLALSGALLLAGCDDKEQDGPVPLLTADDLDHYAEVRDCRFSVEHDAVYIRVLADPLAHAPYAHATYPFPEGAIVAKEEFHDSECMQFTGITVMQRLANGENPEAGNWAWQRLDADLRVLGPEDPRTCATCHLSCTLGRDGVCADP